MRRIARNWAQQDILARTRGGRRYYYHPQGGAGHDCLALAERGIIELRQDADGYAFAERAIASDGERYDARRNYEEE